MITQETVKEWLHLDHDDFDALIDELLGSTLAICVDILRLDSADDLQVTPLIKLAILFAMAYLFEHREDADMDGLKKNMRALLEPDRKAVF